MSLVFNTAFLYEQGLTLIFRFKNHKHPNSGGVSLAISSFVPTPPPLPHPQLHTFLELLLRLSPVVICEVLFVRVCGFYITDYKRKEKKKWKRELGFKRNFFARRVFFWHFMDGAPKMIDNEKT